MEKQGDIVDERLRASKLFDYYGELLKDSGKRLCSLYLLDDLSLSEIADDIGISRQGVHDSLKRNMKQMESFERKLKLIDRSERIEEIIHTLRGILQVSCEENQKKQINGLLEQILELL